MTRGDVERVTGLRRVDVWSFALTMITVIGLAAAWGAVAASNYTIQPVALVVDADGRTLLRAMAIIVSGLVLGPLAAIRLLEHRWPRPSLRRNEAPRESKPGGLLPVLVLGVLAGNLLSQALRDVGAPPDTWASSSGYLIAKGPRVVALVITELSTAVGLVAWVAGYAAGATLGCLAVLGWDALRRRSAKAAPSPGTQPASHP